MTKSHHHQKKKAASRKPSKPMVWEIDRSAPVQKSLGQMGDPQNICEEWYAVLLQIGHDSEGHSPRVPEPWFRVLKFCKNQADMARSKTRFESDPAIRGHILCHRRDTFTLICRNFANQNNPDYVNNKANQMAQEFLDDQRYIDDEFVRSQLARLGLKGTTEDAIKEHKRYIREYQDLGWVKYMKRVRNIPDRVKIIPGMHLEAERMARDLRRGKNVPDILGEDVKLVSDIEERDRIKNEERQAKLASICENDENAADNAETTNNADNAENDENTADTADNADNADNMSLSSDSSDQFSDEDNEFEEKSEEFPQTCRTTNQTLYSMSFVMDKSDEMDCLLFFHAYYASKEDAEKHVCVDLDERIEPLQIHGLDMYNGIFPVRMLWESDTMSSRVKGMVETWTDVRVSSEMTKKAEGTRERRAKTHEAIVRQKREQDGIDQINDRLDISTQQQDLLFAMLDAETIMSACRIEDQELRNKTTAKMLKKAGKIMRARERVERKTTAVPSES